MVAKPQEIVLLRVVESSPSAEVFSGPDTEAIKKGGCYRRGFAVSASSSRCRSTCISLTEKLCVPAAGA